MYLDITATKCESGSRKCRLCMHLINGNTQEFIFILNACPQGSQYYKKRVNDFRIFKSITWKNTDVHTQKGLAQMCCFQD